MEVETHLAKQPFLRFGDGHEPLIRRRGVYFVKAQTVNAVETVNKTNQKNHAFELKIRKSGAYELMIHKIDAYELKIHTIH